jgi:hypothetical protein
MNNYRTYRWLIKGRYMYYDADKINTTDKIDRTDRTNGGGGE